MTNKNKLLIPSNPLAKLTVLVVYVLSAPTVPRIDPNPILADEGVAALVIAVRVVWVNADSVVRVTPNEFVPVAQTYVVETEVVVVVVSAVIKATRNKKINHFMITTTDHISIHVDFIRIYTHRVRNFLDIYRNRPDKLFIA